MASWLSWPGPYPRLPSPRTARQDLPVPGRPGQAPARPAPAPAPACGPAPGPARLASKNAVVGIRRGLPVRVLADPACFTHLVSSFRGSRPGGRPAGSAKEARGTVTGSPLSHVRGHISMMSMGSLHRWHNVTCMRRSYGKTADRGYGGEHQRLRARLGAASRRRAGLVPRPDLQDAARWIAPGTDWDLGHTPAARARTGPEHASCNRGEGAARGTGRQQPAAGPGPVDRAPVGRLRRPRRRVRRRRLVSLRSPHSRETGRVQRRHVDRHPPPLEPERRGAAAGAPRT